MDDQNSELTQPITDKEILSAIEKSRKDKIPGSDGCTNEFYRTFKEIICPILHKLFSWILEKDVWPPTWNSSIVTVIPKEGKDHTECGSYRPISLLNVDQKLFTEIIANRLAKISPYLLNSDQTGFIQGRLLSDNVRRKLNLVDYAIKFLKNRC